jgi:hypothetical protein
MTPKTISPTQNPNAAYRSALEAQTLLLLDELRLAFRWNRPSILLALYKATPVCSYAQSLLKKHLLTAHKQTRKVTVTEKRMDIPLWLAGRPNLRDTVFFVSGLSCNSQKKANAYLYLNTRRELLVENSIRVVFWLTLPEMKKLPNQAPDFWAFRHHVIDFTALVPPVKSK